MPAQPKPPPSKTKPEPELTELPAVLSIPIHQPKTTVDLNKEDPTNKGRFVQDAMEDMKKAEEELVTQQYNQKKKAKKEDEVSKPQEPKSENRFGRIGKGAGKKKTTKTRETVEHAAVPEGKDDVEILRAIIQQMTKTIAPLGKSMDFISEDIEVMAKEYENWRSRAQSAKSQLEEEYRKTDDILQPLHDKLAEIEGQIQEQVEKIHNTKSRIFKNDGIIQGLLHSIITK